MNTDERGVAHEQIPPPLIRRDVIEAAKQAARDVIAPSLAEIFIATPRPTFQAIYDLAAPQLVFGRAVIMGDAAFVARPHAGMGVTKAGLDAQTLARALAALDPVVALADWQSRRLRYGRALGERTRWLGGYLSEPAPAPEAWSAMVPELATTLLTETAISGWMSD
jgi:2-polyprenyl-6-methoxyphenol hydroxylase-like FAD-dependent oxidoreductase